MRATRQRLAKAKNLHSLESLASAWLPLEMLRELASLPGLRMRWLPLPLVFWACLNMVFHPGAPCREAQRSVQAWWKRLGRNWRNPEGKGRSVHMCKNGKRSFLEFRFVLLHICTD